MTSVIGVAFEMAESSATEGWYSHPLYLLDIGSLPGQRCHHRAEAVTVAVSENDTDLLQLIDFSVI